MDSNIEQYIVDHTEAEPDYLKEIVRQSNLRLIHPRMLSGHVQGRVLKMLVSMIGPKRILELGSFAGYSAICMAEALNADCVIDTIEFNDELEDFFCENVSRAGYKDVINLYLGDCIPIIKNQLSVYQYQLVFIDANKRDYIEYYEAVFPLVSVGGYIIADNVLWDGHVVEDNVKKNDFQTIGIKAFNDYVHADERVENVLFPVRDGLMILKKIGNE